MFEMQPYIVYIKPDAQNRIQAVNSSAFLTDTDGWVEIDRGFGDRFHHAQGNYFPKPKFDERGIMRYLYTPEAETIWRERTQEEMDAEWTPPAIDTFNLDLMADHEYRLCCLELGIEEV